MNSIQKLVFYLEFTLALLLWATAPATAQVDDSAAVMSTVAASASAQIQPGDQVSLRILREPDMGGVYTVSQAGEIVLPRLGVVEATRFTVGALQDSLRTAYSVFLRDPVLEVSVLRRIGVQGEVQRPDVYMVDLTVTMRDLLAKAGGVTEAGNPSDIDIVRNGERIPLGRNQGRFTAAELRSGDQIVVGRRSWYAMNPPAAVGTITGLITFVITTVLLVKR